MLPEGLAEECVHPLRRHQLTLADCPPSALRLAQRQVVTLHKIRGTQAGHLVVTGVGVVRFSGWGGVGSSPGN